ncbi:hypothetical protein PanWU01x14_088780 [Parasponia andersonii]|uniref:Uncharacterized protein n=1 Tax=Parasponia andersonii TaxID=3476 RepID=A0A2P5D817_PARAD|nr:hypothetical protein PanWU01x14_088780 [Parasponia andersonii]
MPATSSSSRPKRRKNEPKSAKTMKHTPSLSLIDHSSPTIQLQGLSDLNFQKGKLRISAMEDSSNGKVEETPEVRPRDEHKEVVVEDGGESKLEVESVKNVEIDDDDDSESANKREISILDKIVESAEKIIDGDDSSSSSNRSDDEKEEEFKEKSPQVDEDSGKDDLKQEVGEGIDEPSPAGIEEKTVASLVEEDLVSKGNEVVNPEVSEGSEVKGMLIPDQKNEKNSPALTEEQLSKGTEENPGESSKAADEASNANAQSPDIPENRTNPSDAVSVTGGSPQPTSWTSCCGLFEVLRRSER